MTDKPKHKRTSTEIFGTAQQNQQKLGFSIFRGGKKPDLLYHFSSLVLLLTSIFLFIIIPLYISYGSSYFVLMYLGSHISITNTNIVFIIGFSWIFTLCLCGIIWLIQKTKPVYIRGASNNIVTYTISTDAKIGLAILGLNVIIASIYFATTTYSWACGYGGYCTEWIPFVLPAPLGVMLIVVAIWPMKKKRKRINKF